jgi:type II secretory pathway component PulJ
MSLRNKKQMTSSGFSMMELLIYIAILSGLIVTSATFQKDVFYLNNTLQSSLNAQLDARHLAKVIVAELRKATPSALGAYPLELASSTAVTFYSDVDSNGTIDRVRYFLSGSTIKKGVISPSGSPVGYTGTETVTTLINSVVASSTLPLFQYYPATYTGASSALSQPVDTSVVRLIKITVIIDNNPAHSPAPLIVTSQVTLRNLKDNL